MFNITRGVLITLLPRRFLCIMYPLPVVRSNFIKLCSGDGIAVIYKRSWVLIWLLCEGCEVINSKLFWCVHGFKLISIKKIVAILFAFVDELGKIIRPFGFSFLILKKLLYFSYLLFSQNVPCIFVPNPYLCLNFIFGFVLYHFIVKLRNKIHKRGFGKDISRYISWSFKRVSAEGFCALQIKEILSKDVLNIKDMQNCVNNTKKYNSVYSILPCFAKEIQMHVYFLSCP